MNSRLCTTLGIDFPLFAFSHCRDVVVAVSKAGGFGVFGAASFSPDQLETELRWIDAHIDGRPYGVDLLIPENLALRTEPGATARDVAAQIPEQHRRFVADLLRRFDIDPMRPIATTALANADAPVPFQRETAEQLMDVAFRHPVGLIANALGVPPPSMLQRARAHGIPCAALVGAREHAVRQAGAGVDIIVAQGTEAGGHCGEVSTMVLIPEVVRALRAMGSAIPVLAAGGIMTGRQMAAGMAMGAAGVWTGSVWLATTEAETSEAMREKLVAAGSRDTLRSRCRTGKPARQLRSAWTDAWDAPDSPGTLPTPLQTLLSGPAMKRIDAAVAGGNHKARALLNYYVGQGVGLLEDVRSCRSVVQDFMTEFAEALEDLQSTVGGP